MWELDYKESWVPKNWCFWTVVLEKTLESPLDCKEMQPVHPKGNQSWIFIGRTDAEAEILILWPPDGKSWLIWKDPNAGKDWRQEEKGMTAGSQHTRSHPWQGHEEKTWQARQIRTSGMSKSCPGAHLKDDLCLSDACYIRLLPNFCDTGRRPSLISLQTEST